MKKYALFLFSAIFLFIMGSCTASQSKAVEKPLIFYVSPKGNDIWTGKIKQISRPNGPFATLTHARDVVRALKKEGKLTQPVRIYVLEGIYFLNEPFELTLEDSGTESCPITYAAYPGTHPVLSGGQILAGPWVRNDSGLYQTAIPEVKDQQWYFYQLFLNGKRLTRARIPNEGFLEMAGEMKLEGPAQFSFKEGDIKPEWAERGDVDVIGLAKWAEIRMPLVEVNEAEHTATLTKPVPPSNWKGEAVPRYWIENAPEALDQPGEWRLDRQTGQLSMLLDPQNLPDMLQVIAPRLEKLVILKGDVEHDAWVSYVHFEGLTFEHTIAPKLQEGYPDTQAAADISAAFSAIGAQNCAIENCRFNQIGNYAVEFAQGCRENLIRGNEIMDVGAGGVKIGTGSMLEGNEHSSHNQVTDNHIHHIGVIYPAAVGIWVGQSSDNILAHNHIHDTYYTGISVGWTWGYTPTGAHHNLIEYNDVHDIGQGILSDMGGVYTLGTQPGTVIRNNIFHDIYSHTYGGWGIYPDEGSTQILIENNLTYRTKSAGFHQHYGKENVIRNNIFAFAKEYQVMRTRAENHLSLTFEHNIVIWDEGDLLGSNWKENNYQFDYNLYWNTENKEFKMSDYSWADWQAKGQDVHSQITDPLFVNAKEYDFRLKPDSPALAMGFQPIDFDSVGPRKEYYKFADSENSK